MNRVVVVGAGLIGLCAAFSLHRRGADVTVVESASGANGASVVNAGWVCPGLSEPMPMPGLVARSLRWMLRSDSPLYIRPSLDPAVLRWLFALWRNCNRRHFLHACAALDALNQRTFVLLDEMLDAGVVFEMHRDGILSVFHSRQGLAETLHAGASESEVLGPMELREVEPALSDAVHAAIRHRAERSIRPDSLTAGLTDWLQARSVRFVLHTAVTGFERRGDRVVALRTSGGPIGTDAVLVAAGVHSAGLAAQLGARLPIQAGKGYCLDFDPSPVAVRHPIDFADAHVACTPMGGFLRLAGTMELSGINDTIRPERVRAIADCAARCLRDWPVTGVQPRVRTGLRPCTPDGLPVIGWLPGLRNVAVASGHAMLGLTLAAATGEAVTDCMTGAATPAWLAAFDPARFL